MVDVVGFDIIAGDMFEGKQFCDRKIRGSERRFRNVVEICAGHGTFGILKAKSSKDFVMADGVDDS